MNIKHDRLKTSDVTIHFRNLLKVNIRNSSLKTSDVTIQWQGQRGTNP